MGTALRVERVRARRLASRSHVAIAIALAMTGCMMQPYVVPNEPPVRDSPLDGLIFAGQADESIAAAEAMRREYYKDLAGSAIVRNSTAVIATGLSGWAIYRGLKPANTGSGTASDADKRATLRLGVALGALYGLREFLVNPEQETAESQGYRAVTCMMLASRPLLMTKRAKPRDFTNFSKGIDENNVLFDPTISPADGDLEKLETALQKLDQVILQVNLRLAADRAEADDVSRGNPDVEKSQKPLRDQFIRTEQALRYARHAMADGVVVTSAVQNSGQTIREELNRVAGSVNEQIRASQHDITDATTSIKNSRDLATTVLNIGASTATDQVADHLTNADISAAARDRPIRLAGPMTAAWGVLFGGGSATSIAAVSESAAPAASSAQGRGAAAGPPPAASPTSGATKKSSVKIKGVATKPRAPSNATSSPLMTVAELTKIRDELDKGIQSATNREQAAAKAAEAASAAKQLDALRELTRKISDGLQCAGSIDPGQKACVADLARQTELLYAARRPVAQAVLNFRQLARMSTSAPECADQALIRVTPNEARVALAGETVKYIVSQKVAGKNPIAVLDGPMEASTGVAFAFEAIPGGSAYTATVTVGPRMARQDITLIVSDSSGVASLKLPIAAGGARPKPLDAPQASSAASSSSADSSAKGASSP